MSHKPVALTTQAHRLIATNLAPGAFAVDATAGNGHDALFLAQQLGRDGHLWAFDIQSTAIAATRARLAEHEQLKQVTLLQASHADMARCLPAQMAGKIDAVVFNLGYLPGADKRLTTLPETTLEGLKQARELLAPAGLLSVLAYPGHATGRVESAAVVRWFEALSEDAFHVDMSRPDNPRSPRLLLAQRTGQSVMNASNSAAGNALAK